MSSYKFITQRRLWKKLIRAYPRFYFIIMNSYKFQDLIQHTLSIVVSYKCHIHVCKYKDNKWQLCLSLLVKVARNHASDPQLLAGMLVKLPELRNLGSKHSAHLDWFRHNWTQLRLPPLFAEIFDIPKCEEDLQWT